MWCMTRSLYQHPFFWYSGNAMNLLYICYKDDYDMSVASNERKSAMCLVIPQNKVGNYSSTRF